MIAKIYELWHKALFFFHKWKIVIISATIAAAVVLIVVLVIGGQKQVGEREAGEQIASLAKNIRSRYKARPDYWGLSTKEVIAKKIYPLSMGVSDEGKLIGYFANEVEIGANSEGLAVMPTVQSFVIAYNNLNKAQCIGLAANKFNQEFWLGVEKMIVANSHGSKTFDWSSKELALPASEELVKKCCQKESNSVIFYFK